MMDVKNLEKITRGMDMQMRMCRSLVNLVADFEEAKLKGVASDAEIQHLKEYTEDMLLACDTAGKLVNALTKLAENQEKDKPKKPAEQPKKTETKKAADKTETTDDLSFLE